MARAKAVGKIPVSERAIIQRINRVLRRQDMELRTARGAQLQLDVGRWYVVNTRVNGVMYPYKHADLADIARETGVLRDWEEVQYTQS
jgi:hypothetical protein